MEVRDPIHGPIPLSGSETALVDHPWVQRLRGIRAMGFAHLPFPGATHSRYAHSIGVMHLAGLAVDAALRDRNISPDRRALLRALVRVAALCHDLGHAPFSHSTEFAMPPLADLGLTPIPTGKRRATHEDYTIAILERSSLRDAIDANFPFTARHVAALVSRDVAVPDDLLVIDGVDHRRILSQIISSELDVDRLDYLARDSTYSGAAYGHVDAPWLLSNLVAHEVAGQLSLALDFRAIYAFDHFMIARHHMFLMVYFHHKSVGYEELLKRWVASSGWAVPADLDAYLFVDDLALEHALRTSADPWARRIVERNPYRRVLEVHGNPADADLLDEAALLSRAGIDAIHASSTGELSRYAQVGKKRRSAPPIYVIERIPGLPVDCVHELGDATHVFDRYAEARRIARLYVAPEDVERARTTLGMGV